MAPRPPGPAHHRGRPRPLRFRPPPGSWSCQGSQQLPSLMSSTSSTVPGWHYLAVEGMGRPWQRSALWGGGWASPACRAWGREAMPGYPRPQPLWPPRSLKRTALGLGLGLLGSGRVTGLRPKALTHSRPSRGDPSPAPDVGKASSIPSGCRPTRHSAGGGPAPGGLQGSEPGALSPVALQEWTPQPCPHRWASAVAPSTW